MALVITPAIVLSALRYSETSKIVRLATREHGVQSAIAKGALRPKSRFGAALQLLSEGQAQYLAKEHRELHVLTAFDLQHLHVGLTADLARYCDGLRARRGHDPLRPGRSRIPTATTCSATRSTISSRRRRTTSKRWASGRSGIS